ncbi:MAG: hypothetical protein NC086_00025 [Alistipes sp.]|nr:hypothetical protein [Alistipes sp.]
MKKVFLLFFLCFGFLFGCGEKEEPAWENVTIPVSENDGPYKIKAYSEEGCSILRELGGSYTFVYYGLDTAFDRMVSKDEYDQWIATFQSEMNPDGKSWDICLQKDFIHYFNIPKQQVEEKLSLTYTQEQIDAFYSDDHKDLNTAFQSDYAIMVNGELYSPIWLATHTKRDYEKAGITVEQLEECIAKCDREYMKEVCLPVAYQITTMDKKYDVETLNCIREEAGRLSLYGIPDAIHDIIEEERYEEYMGRFCFENSAPERKISELNIVNILSEFDLDYSTFSGICHGYVSEEECRVLFSRNYEEIDRLFME